MSLVKRQVGPHVTLSISGKSECLDKNRHDDQRGPYQTLKSFTRCDEIGDSAAPGGRDVTLLFPEDTKVSHAFTALPRLSSSIGIYIPSQKWESHEVLGRRYPEGTLLVFNGKTIWSMGEVSATVEPALDFSGSGVTFHHAKTLASRKPDKGHTETIETTCVFSGAWPTGSVLVWPAEDVATDEDQSESSLAGPSTNLTS